MPRSPVIQPGNDTVVYCKGLRDVNDPTNADGSPKYIEDASGVWTLIDSNGYTEREDILASGTTIASGSVIPMANGGGEYRIDLSNSLPLEVGTDPYLRVELTSGSFKADVLELVSTLNRTGKTPVT